LIIGFNLIDAYITFSEKYIEDNNKVKVNLRNKILFYSSPEMYRKSGITHVISETFEKSRKAGT